jgi:hypothetical protein
MPAAPRSTRRAVRPRGRRAIGVRGLVGLSVLAVIAAITLLSTAFGSSRAPAAATAPAPADRLLPAGPPSPFVVARLGSLRLQLPIELDRVTAIGYHASGDGALALEPQGRRGNQGLLGRIIHKLFGGSNSPLTWYQIEGGEGPATATLDVGAAPDTDVYSPVDGTIVGLTDYVIDGHSHGVRIDIRPTSAPSVIVSLTRIRPDPALTVGKSVAGGSDRLGTVLDLSGLERQALARFTQDAGNHVSLEVHPGAALSLP